MSASIQSARETLEVYNQAERSLNDLCKTRLHQSLKGKPHLIKQFGLEQERNDFGNVLSQRRVKPEDFGDLVQRKKLQDGVSRSRNAKKNRPTIEIDNLS